MKNTYLILLLTALGMGCTHSLRLTNTEKFKSSTTQLGKPVALRFNPVGNDRLLDAAVKQTLHNGAVTEAKDQAGSTGPFQADYICQLTRDTKFKASGQNFFISFPGFIVFTHALVGFKYTGDIQTHSTLYDGASNVVSQTTHQTPYEFRHCSFPRGAAAGLCGWVVPGYGAAAILPGAIFAASYDKRATDEFLQKVEWPYSQYISSKLVEQVGAAQTHQAARARILPAPVVGSVGDEVAGARPSESEYAVYVMRVDGNVIGVPEHSVRDLPESARRTLDGMSSTHAAPDQPALEDLLLSLGMSSGEFAGQLGAARVFTQAGEQVLPLLKANEVQPTLL